MYQKKSYSQMKVRVHKTFDFFSLVFSTFRLVVEGLSKNTSISQAVPTRPSLAACIYPLLHTLFFTSYPTSLPVPHHPSVSFLPSVSVTLSFLPHPLSTTHLQSPTSSSISTFNNQYLLLFPPLLFLLPLLPLHEKAGHFGRISGTHHPIFTCHPPKPTCPR